MLVSSAGWARRGIRDRDGTELDKFFGGAGVVANDMHGKVGPCL